MSVDTTMPTRLRERGVSGWYLIDSDQSVLAGPYRTLLYAREADDQREAEGQPVATAFVRERWP